MIASCASRTQIKGTRVLLFATDVAITWPPGLLAMAVSRNPAVLATALRRTMSGLRYPRESME